MPFAYCQKETYKGYARRMPYVKNMVACYMINTAGPISLKLIYYRWKSPKNIMTPP